MELIKNLKRTLEDADEKVTQIERLNESLLKQNNLLEDRLAVAKARNEELQNALCRCRDMIERLREASSPDDLQHEASIYLGILEGLITDRFIRSYPHYSTSPRASLRNEK